MTQRFLEFLLFNLLVITGSGELDLLMGSRPFSMVMRILLGNVSNLQV